MATIISDGASEDLIRSFQQLTCTEGHYKTLIEKYQSELSNGLVDEKDISKRVEMLNDTIDELGAVSELRRAVMLRVMSAYPTADKTMWCTVKHMASAEYTLFEAYQASGDAEILNMYLEANARFVHAITRWLGTEITSCASCLTDILRGEKKGDT